ncbi:MAG: glycosyltransferase [Flavobacteriales bacterium]|nr:glycosyltransferase [Flavobacteriales bacterium]
MGRQELWLFTMRFPFGHGEAFLENELPILAQGFRRVRLFPLLSSGEARPLPAGVEVERLFTLEEAYRPIALWRMFLDLPRVLRLWRQAKASAPSPAVFAKHKREFLSQLRQALERERLLRQRMSGQFDPEQVRLYSYWTSDWATVLGLWKTRNKRVRFVSRMMGFDMFDHRAPDAWQRFQAFHVEQVEHVYTIAKTGLQHMRERFPAAADKFSISYLATTDNGPGPWERASELRIASCSNFVELKRVALIAESLHHVTGPVRWTHFGDGPERAGVEAVVKTLPPNIRVELMGSRPNAEVIAWYKANPVDVFVHASYTEGGAPVALQEAASFGIPLVAADAGGVREVVTGESGVLLPNALTPKMLGNTLNDFRNSLWYTAEARRGVRGFWASMFNATEVYGGLLKELLNP